VRFNYFVRLPPSHSCNTRQGWLARPFGYAQGRPLPHKDSHLIRSTKLAWRTNGPELSCPAARATAHSFSPNSAGKALPTFRTPTGSAAASC